MIHLSRSATRLSPAAARWLPALLLVPASMSASAQIIDFETLPGGEATIDQQAIHSDYASLGVTFSLVDPATGDSTGVPRIAKTGPPLTAFQGCLADDTPYAYLGLGDSFLTDDTTIGISGDLRIDYATPVAQAAGLILDIDCRDGAAPCEQWTITAYDVEDSVLQVVVLDGPEGPSSPACTFVTGPGDSRAFGWTVDVGTSTIASVVLSYTGAASGPGLAFDNFTVSGLPDSLSVSATSAADSICAGESVLLTAFPQGGLPPYTFRWQQQIATGTWVDIGTTPALEAKPPATTPYRVVVTDATATDATSSELVVAVAEGHPLCTSSLIVASNSNNRVVRYGFLSGLGEVFVESGAGGLNGTSEITIGPDENLYVSSQNTDSVLRYDGASGAFIDVFVSPGSGGLNIPVGLDFGPDGDLYVVSNAQNAVQRYDGTTGMFLDTFVATGSGLNNPTDLTFGPDDALYVCSRNTDEVLRFDGATGAPLGSFVTGGSGGLDAPRGLEFGPDGNLYIAEEINDSVRRYDGTTGAFIDVFVSSGNGGLDRANDLVFAPDGILYVASFNNDEVLAYDAVTGAFVGALPNELLDGPAWLTIGPPPPVPVSVPGSGPRPPVLSVEPPVPNPSAASSHIVFDVPTAGPARGVILDVLGRRVRRLFEGSLREGRHDVTWDGRNDDGARVSAGVYFVHIETGGFGATRKLVLLD